MGKVYVTVALELENEEDAEALFNWGVEQLIIPAENRPMALRLKGTTDMRVTFVNAWKGVRREKIQP